MISHGKDIKIFTGNANPKLAADICKIIGTKLGESEVKSFADGEASVSLYETVRGSDVFLVQSTCKPVNDSLMELLIMVDACRRASAGRITAVMPYFGYARQDRKAKSRDPISAKLVANMLVAAGVDRVLTMDLHANQIQGFFDIPVDNLLGNPVFVDYYAKKFGSMRMIKIFIVMYMAICLFGYGLDTELEFWILAVSVGICQGGIQALSRSYYGKIIPKDESSEYFGFFDVFGKFADFFGPLIISFCAYFFHNSKYGVLSLILLFAVGLILITLSEKQPTAAE